MYDEETKPWEGGIITSYCSEFENLDGTGHGVKLEPTSMIVSHKNRCFAWQTTPY